MNILDRIDEVTTISADAFKYLSLSDKLDLYITNVIQPIALKKENELELKDVCVYSPPSSYGWGRVFFGWLGMLTDCIEQQIEKPSVALLDWNPSVPYLWYNQTLYPWEYNIWKERFPILQHAPTQSHPVDAWQYWMEYTPKLCASFCQRVIQPSPLLQKYISMTYGSFFCSPEGDKVNVTGIHIRSQGCTDTYIQQFINMIYICIYKNNEHVVIVSDDYERIHAIIEKEGLPNSQWCIIPSSPSHTFLSDDIDAVIHAYGDWWILSRCNKLILTGGHAVIENKDVGKNKKGFMSMFGLSAAVWSGIEPFLLLNNGQMINRWPSYYHADKTEHLLHYYTTKEWIR